MSSFPYTTALSDFCGVSNTSSVIIFWIVIFIVVMGIFFSGMQFYISLQREKERMKKPCETSEKQQENVTEFEASLQGIKVSSSVIGVIILVISLAFFYLYLVHVYPVSEARHVEQVEQSEVN